MMGKCPGYVVKNRTTKKKGTNPELWYNLAWRPGWKSDMGRLGEVLPRDNKRPRAAANAPKGHSYSVPKTKFLQNQICFPRNKEGELVEDARDAAKKFDYNRYCMEYRPKDLRQQRGCIANGPAQRRRRKSVGQMLRKQPEPDASSSEDIPLRVRKTTSPRPPRPLQPPPQPTAKKPTRVLRRRSSSNNSSVESINPFKLDKEGWSYNKNLNQRQKDWLEDRLAHDVNKRKGARKGICRYVLPSHLIKAMSKTTTLILCDPRDEDSLLGAIFVEKQGKSKDFIHLLCARLGHGKQVFDRWKDNYHSSNAAIGLSAVPWALGFWCKLNFKMVQNCYEDEPDSFAKLVASVRGSEENSPDLPNWNHLKKGKNPNWKGKAKKGSEQALYEKAATILYKYIAKHQNEWKDFLNIDDKTKEIDTIELMYCEDKLSDDGGYQLAMDAASFFPLEDIPEDI